MGLYEIKKGFHTAREMITRVKRQYIGCGKIFTNHISDKGLMSVICIKLQKFNIKLTKHPANV